MPTFTENTDTGWTASDSTGKNTARREWTVDASVAVARLDPQYVAIATTPYTVAAPGGNITIPVDRVDVRPYGEIYAKVEAFYSSDRRFRLPEHVDSTAPTFKGWQTARKRITRKVPVLVNTYVRVFSFAGAAYLPKWSVVSIERRETIKLISRQVVIQTTGFQVIHQIEAQDDKLHQIDGNFYHFEVADITQRDTNIWETVYTWEYDPGTPKLEYNGTPAQNAVYETAPERPPFTNYAVIPGINPDPPNRPSPHFKPEIKFIQEYELDPTGHQNLPGGPF